MKLTIELPEEFEEHFQMDKFEDSLHRVEADLRHRVNSPYQLSGNYEIELIEQLNRSFSKAEVIDERPVYPFKVSGYKVVVQLNFANGDYSNEEYDGVIYQTYDEANAARILAQTCYGIERAWVEAVGEGE